MEELVKEGNESYRLCETDEWEAVRIRCIQGWNRLKILLPVRPVGITCTTGEIPVKNNEKMVQFSKTV